MRYKFVHCATNTWWVAISFNLRCENNLFVSISPRTISHNWTTIPWIHVIHIDLLFVTYTKNREWRMFRIAFFLRYPYLTDSFWRFKRALTKWSDGILETSCSWRIGIASKGRCCMAYTIANTPFCLVLSLHQTIMHDFLPASDYFYIDKGAYKSCFGFYTNNRIL